jgi:ubiquinone/menaquinone biosynthesis C-methylase UbiE
VFDRPSLYESFHRLLSREKFRCLEQYLCDLAVTRPIRVIDFGCGPGTNAFLFTDKERYDYVGVDFNPDYVEWARRRYDLRFVCADLTQISANAGDRYDVVLINSVMHHLTDSQVRDVLAAAQRMLAPEGECVVLDMIEPETPTLRNLIQRTLIRLDRGAFCRKADELERLLAGYFNTRVVSTFDIRLVFRLWHLKLFSCRLAPVAQFESPTLP